MISIIFLIALLAFVIYFVTLLVGLVRRRWRLVGVSLAVIAAGMFACGLRQRVMIKEMTALAPYNAQDPQQQSYFYVVVIGKEGPKLVPFRELAGEQHFYIDSAADVRRQMNDKPSDSTMQVDELKLLQNDRSARSERVYLHIISDEFEYFCVYDATDTHVQPLQFSEITKRSMDEAGFPGGLWFLPAAVAAIVINVLPSRKRASAGQALMPRQP